MKKIGFIGAGKMATAIINGVVKSGFFAPENVFAFDVNNDALLKIKNDVNINIVNSIDELILNADVVLVAIKPFVVDSVIEKIKDKIESRLLISILAGVSTKKYENAIKNVKVIRVMPNTPALVNKGATAVCKGEFASPSDLEFVYNMFLNIGLAIKCDEKYIDIVTAISGSGPAFFYYFINEIAKSGEKLGLDYKTCLMLSAQTAIGSGEMILKSDVSPIELIKNVTTPGGCTEVGNNVLKDKCVDEILFEVVKKTMEKAKALG